jgi:hypothetical protein
LAPKKIVVLGRLTFLAGLVIVPACTRSSASDGPTCRNGQLDQGESGVDCGGACSAACDPSAIAATEPGAGPQPGGPDGVQTVEPTDVGCGGLNAPKCTAGKKCLVDADCTGVCNYEKVCIDVPSCKPHLGGDTCGKGEVGEPGVVHESCCKSLPVPGYVDPRHPGKTVYLDKYEITAGRVRAFLAAMSAKFDGKPNVKQWVTENTPEIWDPSWNKFLPSSTDAETTLVTRNLLGDVRGGPDDTPVPPEDQNQNLGTNFQFNGQLYVYLHGNNCSTHPNAYGFPTFFYPPEVLAQTAPPVVFPPRADGTNRAGTLIPASEHLDAKAMNCISNAMLVAFCHWDGGQLATDEVLDYVTDSPRGPSGLGDRPGCGSQVGTENPPTTPASMTGGRCAPLASINATFDAGGRLPLDRPDLNVSNYVYPFFPEGTNHDKAWEIAAPGRGSIAANGEPTDMVRINPGDEPWMDLHGNLNESVLTMNGATFSRFGLKYRGIGYSSARSELNFRTDWPGEGGVRRIERPEARAGFAGGRCMRFK